MFDFLGGFHLSAEASTVSVGFLYSADLGEERRVKERVRGMKWTMVRRGDLRCSSISLGVTQITCCPFQYFTRFRL